MSSAESWMEAHEHAARRLDPSSPDSGNFPDIVVDWEVEKMLVAHANEMRRCVGYDLVMYCGRLHFRRVLVRSPKVEFALAGVG